LPAGSGFGTILQTSARITEVLLPPLAVETSIKCPRWMLVGPTWPLDPVYSSTVMA
jgi:hypothetical protein